MLECFFIVLISSFSSSSSSSQLTGPLRTIAAFKRSRHLSLLYVSSKVTFWTISFKSLDITSIHRVLGLPRGLVLLIFSTSTFFISCPSALQVCPNHSSHLFLINVKIFGLLYNFCNSSFVLLS
jgi:hypothetical protein